MAPIFALLAGVIMDKMKEAEQRKQAQADMYMQRARELNPQQPMYEYNAQRFNRQMDAQQGESVARILPLALQGAFSSSPARKPGADTISPIVSNQFRQGGSLYQPEQDEFPTRGLRGF
jgi:ABC-type Zn2+ transport system substrate-binding protein/surface adhesin